VASTIPGTAKTIWMSWAASHGPSSPLGPEQQDVDQTCDHRRDRERQIDQRDQQALAPELELGDDPRGGDAEHEVQRDRDRRHQQGESDRGQRVRLGDAGEIGAEALVERLDEYGEQRRQQEQRQKCECRGDQGGADREPIHRHRAHRIQAGRGEHQRVLPVRRCACGPSAAAG
jgi:hypothetical protein